MLKKTTKICINQQNPLQKIPRFAAMENSKPRSQESKNDIKNNRENVRNIKQKMRIKRVKQDKHRDIGKI